MTDRDEWRRLRARERDLLLANGVAWSGLADEYPSTCMFRRGFVESAQVVCSYDSRLDQILTRLPLARSVANDVVNHDDYDFAKLVANPRSSALAALHVGGDRTIQRLVDQGVMVGALGVSYCSRASAKLLADSGLLANVERLVLRSVDDGAQIVSAAPRLRALSIDALDAYALAIPPSVVELACRATGGLDDVAKLTIAPTLERLLVATKEFTWDFESLASFEALRSLNLSAAEPGASYRPIAVKGQRVLPALRELSLGMEFDAQSVDAAARAFGRQLDTLHWTGSIPLDDAPRALRKPLVVGDAGIGAQIDGEFVVGFVVPWTRRPLEYGDDGRGSWFEGGGVAIRN